MEKAANFDGSVSRLVNIARNPLAWSRGVLLVCTVYQGVGAGFVSNNSSQPCCKRSDFFRPD